MNATRIDADERHRYTRMNTEKNGAYPVPVRVYPCLFCVYPCLSVAFIYGRHPWRSADGEDLVEAVGGTRDDVNADELADAARGGGAGVGGRLHRGDIAADDRGDQPGVHLLPADEDDVGRLDHRVRRFDHADQAARFDETERFARKVLCHKPMDSIRDRFTLRSSVVAPRTSVLGPRSSRDPSARGHRQPLDDLVAVHE